MLRRPVLVALACGVPALAEAEKAPLAPPPGSAPIISLAARGVQIYACIAAEGAPAWGAAKPEADLAQADGRVVGRHFEGPTWEAQDGSRVVGSVIDQAPAPEPHAVAWLLLAGRTSGSGALAGTRYVLRRDTSGGEKPAGGCTPGQTARVPYTATYTFYR
ncbi:DUF3455 domain-containing protein [Methylobacterium sp. J-048]|uniref:DUF3455 domain-containing protein n=1 Tax=Methylobacterium sp. J-048 TaxID=2836635 RepID=UPI001FB8CF7A|nr:DUF3455 domain-containing protein [Methylobacterium sp. J-048]MCJ2058695.1 DUF3455 domain-containing protein [Methylobacterium sp. J-048]